MKKRTKRNIILGIALSMMIFSGCINNSAKAAYTGGPANFEPSKTFDGNNGATRQELSGNLDSYKFTNIRGSNNSLDNAVRGALKLSGAPYMGMPSMLMSSLTNSFFENNEADIGGAVYMVPVMGGSIENVMFNSNTASMYGGAIAFYESTSRASYTVYDSIFNNNSAGINGGAIYFGAPGYHVLKNNDFEGNQAGFHGGAIYVNLPETGSNKVTIYSDDGTEHYFRSNTHLNNPQNGSVESNAIYIERGEVALTTSRSADSKITIDDGIAGAVYETHDSHGNVTRDYRGTLNISSSGGGEIALNNQIKDLNLIHKSGTLLLNHGNKLADNQSILENVNLTITPDGNNDIRFDLMNSKLDTLNIRNLTIQAPDDSSTQKMTIAFDVDLNQGKSDILNIAERVQLLDSAGNEISGGHISFDTDHFELNVIADGDAEKFQLLNGGGYPGLLVGENVQFNDITKYIFSVGEDGYINVEKTDSSGLPEAVAAEGIREYRPSTLDGTVVGTALGAMAGESLKINMLASDLDGGGNEGISVAAGQKLEFKNAGTTDGTKSVHGFKTSGNGSVANNIGGEIVVTDSTIKNNTSERLGGAIYSEGGKVTLNANERDVIFKYNTALGLNPDITQTTDDTNMPAISNNNDIYLKDAVLDINGAKNTIIESGIAGTGDIQKNDSGILKLAGDNSLYTGNVTLNGGEVQLLNGAKYFNAASTNVTGDTKVNLINNNPNDKVNFGDLNLTSNASLGIDADVTSGKSDKIDAVNVTGDGKIVIDNINMSGFDPASNGGEFSVITLDESGDSPLLGHVEMSGGNNKELMGPIYKYASSFDPNTGMMKISGIGGSSSAGYNPAVLASPVATLIGGYLTQLNTYDMAFNNMDLYMLMPKEERMALKYANRYAAASLGGVYSPLMMPGGGGAYGNLYNDGNTWFKPYSMFEDVKLKNGPKVSNTAYGSFFGYDSNLNSLSHGWDGMWSVYGGYNGSHQSYDGNSIYQNGGTLGATGMLYKGNFFTGLTANAGANAAKADTMYGDEDFAMFMAGVAWKLGYNTEFFDGKLIIQPNYMMSYSFVDAFDYTNAYGLDIDTKPLNALQFMPGLRIIGNIPGGWKPYLAASMVWTALDEADFKANDVALPELSIKPYFNYGVGLQKSGERFGGFFQTMLRAGGREGVFLQAGFNFAI